MTATEQRQSLSSTFENDGMSIGAATEVIFHMGDGTDDANNRYLNIPGEIAYGINFIPTVACSITKINGKILKHPMSIGTGGWTEPNCRIWNFTVQSGSATVVEVEVKC